MVCIIYPASCVKIDNFGFKKNIINSIFIYIYIGSTALSDTLNWVEKRIVSNAQCTQTYGPSVILSSTMCAIGWDFNGQSTCNGDSGGPLVIDDGGVYLQIGIVSFVSNKGCSSGHPAGYVRIASYLKWISMIARIPIQS